MECAFSLCRLSGLFTLTASIASACWLMLMVLVDSLMKCGNCADLEGDPSLRVCMVGGICLGGRDSIATSLRCLVESVDIVCWQAMADQNQEKMTSWSPTWLNRWWPVHTFDAVLSGVMEYTLLAPGTRP